MIEFMNDYWLSVLVAVYLVGMTLYGHYRGFIRQTVSVAALVISIVAVNLASPYVKTFLLESEGVQTAVTKAVSSALDGTPSDWEQESQPSAQRAYIEELPLPEQIKSLLIENNNSEVYEMLGGGSLCGLPGGLHCGDDCECRQLHRSLSGGLYLPSFDYALDGSGGAPAHHLRPESDRRGCAGPMPGASVYLAGQLCSDYFFHNPVGQGCICADRGQPISHVPIPEQYISKTCYQYFVQIINKLCVNYTQFTEKAGGDPEAEILPLFSCTHKI